MRAASIPDGRSPAGTRPDRAGAGRAAAGRAAGWAVPQADTAGPAGSPAGRPARPSHRKPPASAPGSKEPQTLRRAIRIRIADAQDASDRCSPRPLAHLPPPDPRSAAQTRSPAHRPAARARDSPGRDRHAVPLHRDVIGPPSRRPAPSGLGECAVLPPARPHLSARLPPPPPSAARRWALSAARLGCGVTPITRRPHPRYIHSAAAEIRPGNLGRDKGRGGLGWGVGGLGRGGGPGKCGGATWTGLPPV